MKMIKREGKLVKKGVQDPKIYCVVKEVTVV